MERVFTSWNKKLIFKVYTKLMPSIPLNSIEVNSTYWQMKWENNYKIIISPVNKIIKRTISHNYKPGGN